MKNPLDSFWLKICLMNHHFEQKFTKIFFFVNFKILKFTTKKIKFNSLAFERIGHFEH